MRNTNYDNLVLADMDLQEVTNAIDNSESSHSTTCSNNYHKTVNTSMLPASEFSMFQNACIRNVTIHIYMEVVMLLLDDYSVFVGFII